MEIDERLIKQLADMFSVQNQLAIEQDIERRCDELQDLFDEMIGFIDEHGAGVWAYLHGLKKMSKIRERIHRLEEKIERAHLLPEFKKSVDQDLKGFQGTYCSWKWEYMKVLHNHREELSEVFDRTEVEKALTWL